VRAKGWAMVDSVGHRAIEKYFGISGGVHKETPEFPPKEVREAVNNGEMKEMMKAGGYKEVKYEDNWSKHTHMGGYWSKSEYDKKGNQVKYETSTGYWEKRVYDDNGNEVKFEMGYK